MKHRAFFRGLAAKPDLVRCPVCELLVQADSVPQRLAGEHHGLRVRVHGPKASPCPGSKQYVDALERGLP